MLTLYMKSTCQFCQRVMQIAENLAIPLELKDIIEDEAAAAELEAKEGRLQVPYLVDSDKGVSMFESTDIIDYLRENYAKSASVASSVIRPRVHVGGATCESCEG